MMNTIRTLVVVCLSGIVVSPAAVAIGAEPAITLQTLLDEMVDRAALARFPSPAYTCKQASSYDRDATSPDKQETWYANWDRSQFVREEENDGRREFVLMDERGPGAVVRFWATWHGPRGKAFTNGTLRVYLDGSSTPAIEGPIADVIDRGLLCERPLSQGVSPLTEYKHRGHNLYLPIPYAKHCKITYETSAPVDRGARTGEALYYQINYRTYESGASVETFTMAGLKAAQPLLARVQRRLSLSGLRSGHEARPMKLDTKLEPGRSDAIAVEGPGAICELAINLRAVDLEQALRSTVLAIKFDETQTVWTPLGDFFGIGYKLRPCQTWYTRVTADGSMTCWWVMPFEKSCEIALHNLGDQAVDVVLGEARVAPWNWDDRSMHFHASWRQLHRVDTRGKKGMTGGGAFDVNYVTVQGRGVFVGDTLTLCNGAAAWWGEGDEKIYVDGEAFPSHFGTGTEDYYGYAWCKPARFQAPFHAQPEGGGNLAGGFSVNSRYRALDAIPFAKSIQFDMELWHWAGTRMNYAPTTFWYAGRGATCNIKPDPESAALPVARDREDVVPTRRVEGAIEGESLAIKEKKTEGTVEIQDVPQFDFSGGKQLWWRDGKPKDKLVLAVPVAKAGKYTIEAGLTKAIDYGIVQLYLDDKSLGEPIDLINDGVITKVYSLGVYELAAGEHTLTVEIVGANPKAVKRHMFGLDYLKLTPVK